MMRGGVVIAAGTAMRMIIMIAGLREAGRGAKAQRTAEGPAKAMRVTKRPMLAAPTRMWKKSNRQEVVVDGIALPLLGRLLSLRPLPSALQKHPRRPLLSSPPKEPS